jgi:hypothetical protein
MSISAIINRRVTRRVRRFGAVLFALLACLNWVEASATTCYEWDTGGSGGTSPSLGTICGIVAAFYTGSHFSDGNGGFLSYSVSGQTSQDGSDAASATNTFGTCMIQATDPMGNTLHATQGVTSHSTACPTSACSALAGQSISGVVAGGPASVGHGMVNNANNCTGQISSTPTNIVGCGGTCSVQTFTYDGLTNSDSAPGTNTPAQGGSNCVSSGGATECLEPAKPGCGTVNGDEVCVAAIPPGSCQSYASGGVACTVPAGGSATSPPAPSVSGSPTTPAAPVGSITTTNSSGVTTTTNYYSQSTVSSSGTPVGSAGTGTNVGNGGSGSGTGTGTGGSGPGLPSGDCGATGIACSGSVPTIPDADSIGTTTTNYMQALGSVPIVSAVSGIGAAIPSGECPTGTFDAFDHTFVIDAQCTMWDTVGSLIQLVMLAAWALIGARILLSA